MSFVAKWDECLQLKVSVSGAEGDCPVRNVVKMGEVFVIIEFRIRILTLGNIECWQRLFFVRLLKENFNPVQWQENANKNTSRQRVMAGYFASARVRNSYGWGYGAIWKLKIFRNGKPLPVVREGGGWSLPGNLCWSNSRLQDTTSDSRGPFTLGDVSSHGIHSYLRDANTRQQM